MYEQQPDSQLRKDSIQAVTGIFLWTLLVKTWNFTRSKEDSDTEPYGVPPDKETMRSFLGIINYLDKYSALSAHLTAPLSALTHQAVDYKPGKVHFENFNRLKLEISNIKALPYFDVNAETTLQMDASKKGLGACLIQKGKVICYASRALTKTEQNYQNLEREALGTIWGMDKFHYFLYGKEFKLETNQKPLVSI